MILKRHICRSYDDRERDQKHNGSHKHHMQEQSSAVRRALKYRHDPFIRNWLGKRRQAFIKNGKDNEFHERHDTDHGNGHQAADAYGAFDQDTRADDRIRYTAKYISYPRYAARRFKYGRPLHAVERWHDQSLNALMPDEERQKRLCPNAHETTQQRRKSREPPSHQRIQHTDEKIDLYNGQKHIDQQMFRNRDRIQRRLIKGNRRGAAGTPCERD